jgi:transcriptional regulator with XRE-family HTH domain
MVTDRYKTAFGARVTRLVAAAIPRFQAKYPRFRERGFFVCATDLMYVWDMEHPELPVSKNTLNAWLTGVHVAKGRRLIKLAAILDVSVDYLQEGDPDEQEPETVVEMRQEIPVFAVPKPDDAFLRSVRDLRIAMDDFATQLKGFEKKIRRRTDV